MSANYYASAVVGIHLPLKDEDFKYVTEKQECCNQKITGKAKFCSECGKKIKIEEKFDKYILEEILVKSKLDYSPTTDYNDFVIGIATKQCDLNYESPFSSMEIPDTYLIASELISIKDSILKHPELSKTNLHETLQKSINEGIKVHCVGYCSY